MKEKFERDSNVPTNVALWITNYKGKFDFYLSLQKQFKQNGTLSPKQIASVEKAIAKDIDKKTKRDFSPPPKTYEDGDTLEVTGWYAKKMAEHFDVDEPCLTFKVLQTHMESPKAIKMDIEIESGETDCLWIPKSQIEGVV